MMVFHLLLPSILIPDLSAIVSPSRLWCGLVKLWWICMPFKTVESSFLIPLTTFSRALTKIANYYVIGINQINDQISTLSNITPRLVPRRITPHRCPSSFWKDCLNIINNCADKWWCWAWYLESLWGGMHHCWRN